MNQTASGVLTVVGTPIGNLGDLSPRALETLKNADLIAAEDSRTTALLLDKYGVSGAHILPNHKFNEDAAAGRITAELQSGKNVALVTDAGMPCISDPGYVLVSRAVQAGIVVTVIPGPSACIAAIAVSGFNALSFSFYGFLPRTAGEIRKVLRRVAGEYAPLSVFYESPNRILSTLLLVQEVLPDASVCVCNDLTKRFEHIYRGDAAEVIGQLQANPNASKGEYVLLLYHSGEAKREVCDGRTPASLLAERMVRDGVSAKDAIASLVGERAAGKKELYDASLRLRELFDHISIDKSIDRSIDTSNA